MVRCSRISLRIWSSPLKCSAFPRSEVGFSGRCHWEKCGYMVTLSLHYYHCPPNQHHNVLRLQAGIIFRSNAAARHKVIRPNLRIFWFSFRKICWLQEYQQFMEDFEKLRWRSEISEIPKGNHWINGCKFWGRLAALQFYEVMEQEGVLSFWSSLEHISTTRICFKALFDYWPWFKTGPKMSKINKLLKA